MDAKERLRRYLEQRRELGESELVLDGMPVDDLMSLIGAKGTSATSKSVRDSAPLERESASPSAPAVPAAPPPEPEHRFDSSASTDWRETLRRAGAARPSPDPGERAADNAPQMPAAPANAEQLQLPQPDVAVTGAALPEWLTALGVPPGLSSGLAPTALIEPAIASLPTLDALAEMVRSCTRCDLYRTAINPVPGEGDPNADFVCVGEAPGQSEDEQGRPFVGAAGSLLDKILAAIQLERDQVFVCNVLKHRPPGNRDPLPDEVRACEPYLRRQLELVKPRVILALGRFAAQSLLQTTTPIGKLRGHIHRYHGVPLIVTYHPAALLRNAAWKRPTWDDVRLARRVLDASRAAAGA